MALDNASPHLVGDNSATTPTAQRPVGENKPVKRSRNSISKQLKSLWQNFWQKFVFTFGTKRGYKRLKKITQRFFAFVSMLVVGIAGLITLIGALFGWW